MMDNVRVRYSTEDKRGLLRVPPILCISIHGSPWIEMSIIDKFVAHRVAHPVPTKDGVVIEEPVIQI